MEGTNTRQLCQEGGDKAEDMAGVRNAERHGGGISVLRETFGGSVRFKIPWYDSDVFG